ncbi:MAG: ABC-type dipeptide/oligopeptide/nickel transport system, permease component [Frankiales bacterium]|nr:ABC-type dipeptide/oligopeptide/nickel transport system, permease component [Frankiales bacterium]
MLHFVLKRLVAMIAVLLFLTAFVFVLQKNTPIDGVRAKLGANASQQLVDAEKHRLGLDDPVAVQYVHYVGDLTRGDFQDSLRTRKPVSEDLATYLPASLELVIAALLLAVVLGTALGIGAAARWRGAGLLRLVLVTGASAPVFLLALVGILVFYRQLGWLPATGRSTFFDAPTGPTGLLTFDSLVHGRFDVFTDALKHLVMPAVCLALGPAVAIARTLRSSLLTNLAADHARTARAKGLRDTQVLLRHSLRNSAGPVLSMTGLQVGLMFAAVVVLEQVFAWPGIGLYVVQSIPRADFPAIAGVTLVLGALYVVVNGLVDVLQAAADPRIAR